MQEFTLVIVDTTGIQSYIFGSNRLRENVGASQLVHLATKGWLLEDPDSFLPTPHNIDKSNDPSRKEGSINDSKHVDNVSNHIEGGQVNAEVLYAGGGNVAILFKEPADATEFAQKMSSKLLIEAPGLDAVLVKVVFDWESQTDGLAGAMDKAQAKMSAKKSDREWSQPVMGLGVTAVCQSTGFDAHYEELEPVDHDDDSAVATRQRVTISAEIAAKWEQNGPAKERLKAAFPQLDDAKLKIPNKFDQLGRSEGDYSYLAVVHADGNGMGQVLTGITDHFKDKGGTDNRAYIDKLRRFSKEVDQAGLNSLEAVVNKVSEWNSLGGGDGGLDPYIVWDDSKRQKKYEYLSMRPIVFGGDDVTFVCDGRIALRAAQIYLDAFSEQQIHDVDDKLLPATAAAGISLVKVRYPFARAYELSEALCKNAKEAFNREVSALDWHMAQSGLFGSLGEIRRREYDEQVGDDGNNGRSLLMRPISIHDYKETRWDTWENFVTVLHSFQDTQKWPRNRVLQLRDALRQSSPQNKESVESFVERYSTLPAIVIKQSGYERTGWDGTRCIYFDAIEMIEQEILE